MNADNTQIMNANGFMGNAENLQSDSAQSRLRVQDQQHGQATHIGYVRNDLNISKPKADYGVTSPAQSWSVYGRPPYWTEAEVAELRVSNSPRLAGGFVFTVY